MRNFSSPSSRLAWILVISAVQLLGPTRATAGILPTGDFTPTYNGTDDPWNVGGDLIVGETSSSVLSIDGGSEVNNLMGFLGHSSGSTGTVTVTGNGSTWNNSFVLYVGRFGDGTLNIDSGGTVNSSTGYIGSGPGRSGEVNVTGEGSSWNSFSVIVGDRGIGTLNIEADGVVVATGGAAIGSSSGSVGVATVSGAGSTWEIIGRLDVARSGNGTLNISSGVVNVSDETIIANATIGDTAFGVGAINFDQGTLNTGGLKASPAELRGTGTINSKGLVSDVDVTFNTAFSLQQQLVLNSVPDQNITINLDMSVPEDNYSLGAGFRGTGTLTIADGITVDSNAGFLGDHPGSNGTATVTGAGSTWNNVESPQVGIQGNGQLNIEDGAHVISSSQSNIANHSGSTGTVTVSGSGSTWDHNGAMFSRLVVGRSGDGELNIADGGVVNVAENTMVGWRSSGTGVINFNGGTLNTGGLFASTDDLLGTGTINTYALVSDVDLTFDSTHGLQQQLILNSLPGQNITLNLDYSKFSLNRYLGAGYRSVGTLTIADGLSLGSYFGELGYHAGSTGTATISGSGSHWSILRTLNVGNSGDGTLRIENGGFVYSIRSNVGFLGDSTGTVTVTGAGSRLFIVDTLDIGFNQFSFDLSGEGFVNIFNEGLLQVSGNLLVSSESENNSHVNMKTGGILALQGEADDSLTEFLDLIIGSDAINYWDGTTWSDITNATLGLDYTLDYHNTGFLAGHTLLTVGTPGDFDGDRDVDGSDFLILQRGMGTLYGTSELEAWETNYGVTPLSQPGDFNNDGGVDGSDFLAWQRGESPDPFSASDLANWEAQYGTAALTVAAVPEPTSIVLLGLGVFGVLRRKRPKWCRD